MATRYRGYHDIGGDEGGPIRKDEFPFAEWQKLSEALRGALEARNKTVSLDEIRRVFESFGEDLYNSLGFYERRAEALTLLLNEKGIVAAEEVRSKMNELAAARGLIIDHIRKTISKTSETQG